MGTTCGGTRTVGRTARTATCTSPSTARGPVGTRARLRRTAGGRPAAVLASTTLSCANPTLTSLGVAAAPPPCPVHGRYPDYFAATRSIAIDGIGHLVFAYTSPRWRTGRSRSTCGPRTMGSRREITLLGADQV